MKVCPYCGSTRYIKYGHGVKDKAETQKYLCKKCFTVINHFAQSGRLERKEPFNDMDKEK